MNSINQIVVNSLLNSVNRSNRTNQSTVNTNLNSFDYILKNTFGGLKSVSGGCSCNNNSIDTLGIINTLIGTINMNKIGTQNILDNTISNNAVGETKTPSKIDNAIDLLKEQIGKPYVWGANGPESFDCSGLVRYIYKNALGKDIPRTSSDQSKFGQTVDKKELQPGDLVFFDTMKKGRVSHVGMYIGDGEFIHASNPKDGVKKSKLSGYYESVYKGAKRP